LKFPPQAEQLFEIFLNNVSFQAFTPPEMCDRINSQVKKMMSGDRERPRTAQQLLQRMTWSFFVLL
jgi:hypothetical protein